MDLQDFSEEELTTFYKKIGNNVKRLREKKGITQQELALAINHNSVGHIAKAELYKYNKHFSLDQLYKIGKVLKVSPSKLIE